MKPIYLDYAATTPVAKVAKDSVINFMNMFYNPSSPYADARGVRAAIEKARADIAHCINAEPEEIYFTSGATESNNIAIQGAMKKVKGRFITSAIEHPSVLNLAPLYEDNSYIVDVGYHGELNMKDFKAAIDTNDFVSIMMMNNEIGYINNIVDIVNYTRSHKGITHSDATQAIGHIPVDVRDLRIDMLSASGHKFGATKGVGFLFVRKNLHIPALTYGGGQERGFRSGTENVGAIVGMAAALKESCAHIKEDSKHMSELSEYFLSKLKQSGINYSLNYTDTSHYSGNMNICFMGTRGEELVEFLSSNGVYVSSGSACHSNDDEPSHVLTAMGLSREEAEASIRISLAGCTTKEEMDRLFDVIKLYYTLRGDET